MDNSHSVLSKPKTTGTRSRSKDQPSDAIIESNNHKSIFRIRSLSNSRKSKEDTPKTKSLAGHLWKKPREAEKPATACFGFQNKRETSEVDNKNLSKSVEDCRKQKHTFLNKVKIPEVFGCQKPDSQVQYKSALKTLGNTNVKVEVSIDTDTGDSKIWHKFQNSKKISTETDNSTMFCSENKLESNELGNKQLSKSMENFCKQKKNFLSRVKIPEVFGCQKPDSKLECNSTLKTLRNINGNRDEGIDTSSCDARTWSKFENNAKSLKNVKPLSATENDKTPAQLSTRDRIAVYLKNLENSVPFRSKESHEVSHLCSNTEKKVFKDHKASIRRDYENNFLKLGNFLRRKSQDHKMIEHENLNLLDEHRKFPNHERNVRDYKMIVDENIRLTDQLNFVDRERKDKIYKPIEDENLNLLDEHQQSLGSDKKDQEYRVIDDPNRMNELSECLYRKNKAQDCKVIGDKSRLNLNEYLKFGDQERTVQDYKTIKDENQLCLKIKQCADQAKDFSVFEGKTDAKSTINSESAYVNGLLNLRDTCGIENPVMQIDELDACKIIENDINWKEIAKPICDTDLELYEAINIEAPTAFADFKEAEHTSKVNGNCDAVKDYKINGATQNGELKNVELDCEADFPPVIYVEKPALNEDLLRYRSTNEDCSEHETGEINAEKLNGCALTKQTCIGEITYTNSEEICGSLGGGEERSAVRTSTPDLERVRSPVLSPARIVRAPQSVTVLRGESVTLAIGFSGHPAPDVTWMKGGRVLGASDGGRLSILEGVEMSVVTVTDVTADDSGKYEVTVENDGGGDSCFASVAVVGFPEPPGGEPNVSEVTDHSLVLSWYGSMYDGGSVVTGYHVEMSTLPDKKWYKVASSVNTSCTVLGLSKGQRYVFRVCAENRYGVSHPSKQSQVIRLDDFLEESSSDEETEDRPPPISVEIGTSFTERFDLKEEVGKGRFGIVYRCVETSCGRPRAAKVIRCLKVKDREKVRQEIDIMSRLHHPKLMQVLAAFESGRNMIMVMEYISGGELFERVIADDFVLTEQDCILFVRQICSGVGHMHRNGILHLDLKPENILCKTRTSHKIKIIDFGLAREYHEDESLRVLFGTPEFVAPEIISYEPVCPASDMWSIGVICYVLLSGLSPFMGDSDPETFANITRGDMDFDDEAFDEISQDAKDFISRLLLKNVKNRMSAEMCLEHPWLSKAAQVQKRPLSTEKLKRFIIRRKWQKSGTAIRALGRMVSLSRSSLGSSCDSYSPLGSPTSSRSRSSLMSRSETAESGESDIFQQDAPAR